MKLPAATAGEVVTDAPVVVPRRRRPGPSPIGTTLARTSGAGMAAVLVAVDRSEGDWVLPIFAVAALWGALTAAWVLRRGWTAHQARAVAVVDWALVVALIAATGADTSNAMRVLWIMPLAWAVVADAFSTRLLLGLGGLAFLAFWVPAAGDESSETAVKTLGTFGSSYLAAVAIAFVALRVRSEAEDQRRQLVHARLALTRELGQVERDERERLAIQVHDGPLQSIISARQDLVDHLEGDEDALDIGIATLDESIAALRGIATDLYPDQDGGATVQDQLRSIAAAWEARGGFQVRMSVDPAVGSGSDGMLVGMVAELVGNAAKHASPTLVSVRLKEDLGQVVLDVTDDGKGMTHDDRRDAESSGHIGLRSLDRRIRAIGGHWEIRSAPGRGTVVHVRLPR
jgi:two-component system, NarL family, sensor kinase